MTPLTKNHLKTLNAEQTLHFQNSMLIYQASAKRLAAKKSILGKNHIYTLFVEEIVSWTTDQPGVFVWSLQDGRTAYTLKLSLTWYGGELMSQVTLLLDETQVFLSECVAFKKFLDTMTLQPFPLAASVFQRFVDAAKPFEVKPRKLIKSI